MTKIPKCEKCGKRLPFDFSLRASLDFQAIHGVFKGSGIGPGVKSGTEPSESDKRGKTYYKRCLYCGYTNTVRFDT